jgi:hypothetical protein
MVDGPLWPECPELDSVLNDSVIEQLHPESGPSCICCINPEDFAIDSESIIFWKKNSDSVFFSAVRSFDICGFPETGMYNELLFIEAFLYFVTQVTFISSSFI